MNKKVYEVAKVLAAIVLPAFATFYVTLANSWGWGNTEQIVATVTAVATLLGILVKAAPPYDGVAYTEPTAELDAPDKFTLHLSGDPADLPKQKVVRLKVTPHRPANAA